MKTLLNNAERFEQYLDTHLVDENGLVLTVIDARTEAPLTEDTFAGGIPEGWHDWCVPGFTRPEFGGYENVGMTTGAYLNALVHKYHVTGAAETLEKIRAKAGALLRVAELGRELEWGFFPKCYGGRFSLQTSTDQVQYVMSALDNCYGLLDAETRLRVADLMVSMVEFWRKRDYKYTYFIYKDMAWPPLRFPPLLYLASKYSGDPIYRREAEALTAIHWKDIPQNSRFRQRELGEYEKKHGVKIIEALPDCVGMDTLNAELVLRTVPDTAYAETWRESMLVMWREGERGLAPDGNCYTTLFEDLHTGELRQADDFDPAVHCHGARTGMSTMILRGGLQAARRFPGECHEILARVRNELLKFDVPRQFSYIESEDAVRLPERFRFKSRFISGDALTNYLWNCWLLAELETASND